MGGKFAVHLLHVLCLVHAGRAREGACAICIQPLPFRAHSLLITHWQPLPRETPSPMLGKHIHNYPSHHHPISLCLYQRPVLIPTATSSRCQLPSPTFCWLWPAAAHPFLLLPPVGQSMWGICCLPVSSELVCCWLLPFCFLHTKSDQMNGRQRCSRQGVRQSSGLFAFQAPCTHPTPLCPTALSRGFPARGWAPWGPRGLPVEFGQNPSSRKFAY